MKLTDFSLLYSKKFFELTFKVDFKPSKGVVGDASFKFLSLDYLLLLRDFESDRSRSFLNKLYFLCKISLILPYSLSLNLVSMLSFIFYCT